MGRIGVVVPLYNEAPHVEAMLAGLPGTVDSIVVVDDASTDGSRALVERQADPRIRLVSHPVRSGVGAALRSGFIEAASLELDVIVTMDADGQMDVADFEDVVAPVLEGRADYVKGSRFERSSRPSQMPVQRRVANRVLTRVTATALGLPELRDAHCGYTAASGPVIAGLAAAPLYGSYGVYTSILEEVLRMPDVRIEFVPVNAIYGDETSHIRAVDLVGIAGLIARYGMERAWRIARRVESRRS